jgi:hypothetical protein
VGDEGNARRAGEAVLRSPGLAAGRWIAPQRARTRRRAAALTLAVLVALALGAVEGCRAAIVVGQINRGQVSLKQGQNVLEAKRLDATQTDLQQARTAFQGAESDFAAARTAMRYDPLIWAGAHLPVIGRQARAAADLAGIGEHASAIGIAGVDAAGVFDDVRATGNGTMPEKSVAILDRTAPSFATIQSRLSAADALRSDVGSGALLPPLARAVDQFDARRQRVADVVQSYDDAREFVPEFLGFSGPKRYLLLAQNNAELLPTGGLVSVVGVLRVDHGRVEQTDFRDAVQFGADWMRNTGGYEAAPQPLDEYLLKGTSWNLSVSNWSPDFPTAALQAEHFYELGGGEHVDGVIAINVRTLERLLAVTGPVSVPEYIVTATAANVFDLTEQYTRDPSEPRSDRKAFVALLANDLLERVLKPQPGGWSQLIDLLQDLAVQKDLMVYSHDPRQQQLIRRLGWGGEVGYGGAGDFLMLVDASVNGTKLNAVVEQSLHVDVQLDSAGSALTTVTANYFNNLRPWESGRDPVLAGKLMLGGQYGGYVRLYTPPGSVLVDVRSQGRDVGFEESGPELGLTVFGRFFTLARDERQELAFRYRTPPAFADAGDGAYAYKIDIRRQPGQRELPVTLVLTPPRGMRATALRINGGREQEVPEQLRFDLSTDYVIEYRLERMSSQ